MEIGHDPLGNRDLDQERLKIQQDALKADTTKETQKKGVERASLQKDTIQSNQVQHTPLKQSLKMNRPLLPEQKSQYTRMSDAIRNAITTFDLPTGKALIQSLSPEIQEMHKEVLENAMFSPSNPLKPNKFFDTLSHLIPLGASILNGLGSDEHVVNLSNMKSSMITMLQEMGELMSKHGESSTLSHEGKKLLSLLSGQLASLPNSGAQSLNEELRAVLGSTATPNAEFASHSSVEYFTNKIDQALSTGQSQISVKGNHRLINDLVDANLLPPSTLEGKSISAQTLSEIRSTLGPLLSGEHSFHSGEKPMAPTIAFLASFLSSVEVFPEKTQSEVIKVMISTQPILSHHLSNRALGPHTVHLANSLSHFSVDLTNKLGLIPDHPTHIKSVSEYFSRLFAGLIITASILGRLQVDRGDGKAISIDEINDAGKAQRNAAAELKVVDLPPFSFFALWAPFRDLQKGHSKEHKRAASELAKLMRILMKLFYLLTMIITGGKKIGDDGVDILLDENRTYLIQYIDDLVFSLKKIAEIFGVDSGSTIHHLKISKSALLEKKYPDFWMHIFQSINEKGDIHDFLEEVEVVDSFYDTLRTLVSGSGFDTTVVRM